MTYKRRDDRPHPSEDAHQLLQEEVRQRETTSQLQDLEAQNRRLRRTLATIAIGDLTREQSAALAADALR